MRFIRSRHLAVSALTMAVALMTMIGVGAPAQAATASPAALGNCGTLAAPNDRVCILATRQVPTEIYWVILHVYTGSDGHDHAWGQADGWPAAWVYLDVSHDGGNSWTGWQDQGRNGGSTGVFRTTGPDEFDGPGTWVRAGAVAADGKFLVTGWN
ncbi:MAG TPA: hypothetical protein VJ914_04065 [Pseudonocardiaceae bacterium]|nr:hypothetical protein [Pseudonocardiaceae bacterium]